MTQTTAPALLITGATGNTGTELAKQLSANGAPFRALVRSIENAGELAALPGIELVSGDLGDPDSLAATLKGTKRAFLHTNSSEQAEALQLGFVDAARRAGVQHIVKLSHLAASIDSPVRFLRYHAAVEQHIRASGMAYTFLRPNLFMQGLLGFSGAIAAKGIFFASIGEARVSLHHARGEAAAVTADVQTVTGRAPRSFKSFVKDYSPAFS